MEQLLKITSIPIEYEIKIKHATIQQKQSTAELEISRDQGGLKIKSRPIKVNIDTFEARNSINPTIPTSIKQQGEAGKTAAYEATAELAQQGQLMMKAKLGEDAVGQIIAQKYQPKMKDFTVGFIPTSGPSFDWSGPDLTINYEMDKLNFDLKIANGNFEFIPGDISISITQYPDIKVEYVGEPIYIPPSSAPNYEGVDIMA